MKIFCLYQFDTEALCQLGWQWGYLAQNGVNGRFYYHLATTEPTSEPPPPAAYLSAADDKTVRINLQMIPYAALEQLNQIVEMQMDGGELTAVPHFARMGAAPPEMASLPLMSWLRDNVPAFATAQKTIQSRWGQQIVHNNLLIAHVKDLPLRVKIEQTLDSSEFIALSDEYIAFSPQALTKVKRIVTQMGLVIKNG